MNQKELKELIEFIIEKGIAEFELERGDVKVKIKRASEPPPVAVPDSRYFAVHSAPVAAAAPVPVPASPPATATVAAAVPPVAEAEENLHVVRSPIVGTFYEAPSPGAPPFVKVGDAVEVGQVLCIVEAMKLMNEIECDFAGEVVKKFVTNGQPIEYGQELFALRTK
jgi:acetyl-CoA carboxylase biotin carboxyl carrier protein